jgi:hypothetical protein
MGVETREAEELMIVSSVDLDDHHDQQQLEKGAPDRESSTGGFHYGGLPKSS